MTLPAAGNSKADGPRVAKELKYFFQAPEGNVLFFHGGTRGIIKDLLTSGRLHENTISYFTFPWYVSHHSMGNFARFLSRLRRKALRYSPKSYCLLLNSEAEYKSAAEFLPGLADFVHFSNASFLNEGYFDCADDKPRTFDAVYNARASVFKRHHLSADVPSKAFIAYEWRREEVDLTLYNAQQIYRDLPYDQIGPAISRAKVGLMLSAEEGACYASLEYLLTGLPVVSTPSRGGRDAYYTPETAVIVEPAVGAVADGVRDVIARQAAGEFPAQSVRAAALATMQMFRDRLDADIESRMRELGFGEAGVGLLAKRLAVTSKLWKFRNMWLQQLPDVL